MLFAERPRPEFHSWYNRLANPAKRSSRLDQVRSFCEQAYEKLQPYLDADFLQRFRTETPHRFSELYFGKALSDEGWNLQPSVKRFDFHFKDESGQSILVEVVTPRPVCRDGIEEDHLADGTIVTSMSGQARTESIKRLTSAFYDKSKIISCVDGHQEAIKIIAISGIRLRQEGYWPIGSTGLPADFLEAFLPIGAPYVTINLRDYKVSSPMNYSFNDHIKKNDISNISKNAFIGDEFKHIDAILYSEMELGKLDRNSLRISCLMNPFSRNTFNVPVGCQYSVKIEEDEFLVLRSYPIESELD